MGMGGMSLHGYGHNETDEGRHGTPDGITGEEGIRRVRRCHFQMKRTHSSMPCALVFHGSSAAHVTSAFGIASTGAAIGIERMAVMITELAKVETGPLH